MKKSDVDLLAEAFDEATALDGEEKAQFVANFTAEHTSLGGKLRRLLKLDACQDDILHGLVSDAASAMSENAIDPWLGKSFGPWTISKRIGAGGMGAVFLAHRGDGAFDQNVAIKVMGSQILSETAAARFRFERQTLANLRHPNIAKLIDGGSTDLNLPYLVMEYIEGLPIDDYCEERSLSIADRLTLFQKVCRTVDYAHRNLIVHRDLKPDNILVEEDGEPKLLDFGVARLIEQQDEDDEESQAGIQLTQPGSRILTLEYASPEQVRGETVTIATDIYALGVLLYRLLADASPYGDKPTTIRDFEDVILNYAPKPPSTASSVVGNSQASDPNDGTAPIFRRAKRLSHDLDNIVLKCLQKDPDHRYSSAKELSDDLSRYLNNEPVEARPAAWWYVAGKFLKRNLRATIASAAVAIAGIVIVAYYTFELSRERDNAAAAAVEARLSASEAREVSDFLVTLLQGASPEIAQGSDLTVRELLREGVNNIDRIEGQPDLKARLLMEMVNIHIFLGDRATTQALAEKARDLFVSGEAGDPKMEAAVYRMVGESLMNSERYDEAVKNMKIGYDLALKAFGPSAEETAYIQSRLGLSYFQDGDYDQAIQTLQDALTRYAEAATIDSEQYIDILGNLAISLDAAGKFSRSSEIHRKLVEKSERISGKLHPNTIIRLSNRGFLYNTMFEFPEARDTLQEAVHRADQVFEDSDYTHSMYRSALALSYANLGEFDRARDLASAAVELALEHFGLQSRYYTDALARLALIRMLHEPNESLDADLKAAQKIVTEAFGEESSRNLYIEFLYAKSAYGRQELETALSIVDHIYPYNDRLNYQTRRDVQRLRANILDSQGRYDQSALIYREEIALLNENNLFDKPVALPLLTSYAAHLRGQGKLDEATRVAEKAVVIGKSHLPDKNWRTALAKLECARTLRLLGRNTEAKTYAEEAYAELSAVFDSNHPDVQTAGTLFKTLAD